MTLPTSTTIQQLTRPYLLKGYRPGGYLGPLIRKMPLIPYPQAGQQIRFNRGDTAPTPAVYAAGDNETAAPLETTLVTLTFQRLGAQLELDIADALAASDVNDQLQVQIQALKVQMIRLLLEQLCTGDGSAPNLNGFAAGTDTSQTTGAANGAANGGVPTIEDVALLVTNVTASDDYVGAGPDCLAGTSKAGRFLYKLMRDAGETPMFRMDPDLGVPIMHFMGLPFYIGPFATNETKGTGTNLTSIYAFKKNGPSGVHIAYSPLNGNVDAWGMMAYMIPDQLGIGKRGAGGMGYYQIVYPELASIARLNGCDLSGMIG